MPSTRMEAITWCWSLDTTARSRPNGPCVLRRESWSVLRDDVEAHDLESQVEKALASTDVKWHFQHRNGDVASELLAAGEEQLAGEGPETRVVLVVGGPAHKIDRYFNSTPTKVIRHDRFEVVVVP
jgi:hypothetical protein